MFFRYIDLSRVDFLTGNTTEQSTANCYVVRKQGNYKFPIVYGNSIKDGKENKDSFRDFHPIIEPGIISDEEWKGGGDICAKVLWSDNCNIILPNPSIDFKYRYIKFKLRIKHYVDREPGNLVIGLYKDGICKWVWHIWYYPGEFKLNTIDFKCKKYLPDKYKKISFLSIPLGYCGTVLDRNLFSNDENDKYNSCCLSELLCYYKYGYPFPVKYKLGLSYSELISKYQVPIVSNIPRLWSSEDQENKYTLNSLRKKVVTDPCPPGFKLPGSDFITALRWELQKGNSKLYGSGSDGYNFCLGGDIQIIGRRATDLGNYAIDFGLCDCTRVGVINRFNGFVYNFNKYHPESNRFHPIIPSRE